MGCDYYHEAVKVGHDGVTEGDVSDEPGELTHTIRVKDENGKLVQEKEVTVEVPVKGRVYVDTIPERPPIWAR